jgi:hypothetical protein
MRIVAGTHAQEVLPHTASSRDKNTRLSLEVAVDVDEGRAVDVVLKAGEMSLHHPYTRASSRTSTVSRPF